MSQNIKLLQSQLLAFGYVNNEYHYNALANLGQRYGEKGSGVKSENISMYEICSKIIPEIEKQTEYIVSVNADNNLVIGYEGLQADKYIVISEVVANEYYSNVSYVQTTKDDQLITQIKFTKTNVNFIVELTKDGRFENIEFGGYIIKHDSGMEYVVDKDDERLNEKVEYNINNNTWGGKLYDNELRNTLNSISNDYLEDVISIYNENFKNKYAYVNLLKALYSAICNVRFSDNVVDGYVFVKDANMIVPQNAMFNLELSDNTNEGGEQILFTTQGVNVRFVSVNETNRPTDTIYVNCNYCNNPKNIIVNLCIDDLSFLDYSVYKYIYNINYLPYIGEEDGKWYINNSNTNINAKGINGNQPNICFTKTYCNNDGTIGAITLGNSGLDLKELDYSYDDTTNNVKTIAYNITQQKSNGNTEVVFILPKVGGSEDKMTLIKNLFILNISDVEYYGGKYKKIDETTSEGDINFPIVTSFWYYHETNDGGDWKYVKENEGKNNTSNTTPLSLMYLTNTSQLLNCFSKTVEDDIVRILNGNGILIDSEENNVHNGFMKLKWKDVPISIKRYSANVAKENCSFVLEQQLNSSNEKISLKPYTQINNRTDSKIFTNTNLLYKPSLDLDSVILNNIFAESRINILSALSNNKKPYYCYIDVNETEKQAKIGTEKLNNEKSSAQQFFANGNLFGDSTTFNPITSFLIDIENTITHNITVGKGRYITSEKFFCNWENSNGVLLSTPSIAPNGFFGKNAFILTKESYDKFGKVEIDTSDIANIEDEITISEDTEDEQTQQEPQTKNLDGIIFVNRIFASTFEDIYSIKPTDKFSYIDSIRGVDLQYVNAQLSDKLSVANTIDCTSLITKYINFGENAIRIEPTNITTPNIVVTESATFKSVTEQETETENILVNNNAKIKNLIVNGEVAVIPRINGGWSVVNNVYQKNITPIGYLAYNFSGISFNSTTMFFKINNDSYLNLGQFLNNYFRNDCMQIENPNDFDFYNSIKFSNEIWLNTSSTNYVSSITTKINILNGAQYPVLKLNDDIENYKYDGNIYVYPEFQVTAKLSNNVWIVAVQEVGNDNNKKLNDAVESLKKTINDQDQNLQRQINNILTEISQLRGLIQSNIKFDANGGTLN